VFFQPYDLEKIMSELFEIDAKPRTDTGKGASRRLRRTGYFPGIIYGAHQEPEMISLKHSEMLLHLEHEAFYSHILTLNLGGKKEQVILKDLQRHPAKPFVMHADFLRVSAKEKIKTHVPLHFINESVVVKKGGAVSHHISDVEVSCLPKDLPEFIEVDVSGMEVGDTLLMSGINLPAGVDLPALAAGEEHDLPVVGVHTSHGGSEEEDEAAEAAEE
jgi:large subunit ribosomal protein L25